MCSQILGGVYAHARLWVQVCGYSGYCGYMPTKVRHIRVPDDVWEAAQARAYADRTSASEVAVEALREYGRSGARVAASGAPEPRRDVQLPEPVYPEGGPDCRHPSASVMDGVCGTCGTEVWLR